MVQISYVLFLHFQGECSEENIYFFGRIFTFLGNGATKTNLILLLLLGGKLLLEVGSRFHRLPRFPVRDEQRLGEFGEALVDVNLQKNTN